MSSRSVLVLCCDWCGFDVFEPGPDDRWITIEIDGVAEDLCPTCHQSLRELRHGERERQKKEEVAS